MPSDMIFNDYPDYHFLFLFLPADRFSDFNILFLFVMVYLKIA